MKQIPRTENVEAVVKAIRDAIAEDWIYDEEIAPNTQFDRDLQLESIEMVKVVQLLHERFEGRVDLIEWFAACNFHDLVELDVGGLALALATDDGVD